MRAYLGGIIGPPYRPHSTQGPGYVLRPPHQHIKYYEMNVRETGGQFNLRISSPTYTESKEKSGGPTPETVWVRLPASHPLFNHPLLAPENGGIEIKPGPSCSIQCVGLLVLDYHVSTTYVGPVEEYRGQVPGIRRNRSWNTRTFRS